VRSTISPEKNLARANATADDVRCCACRQPHFAFRPVANESPPKPRRCRASLSGASAMPFFAAIEAAFSAAEIQPHCRRCLHAAILPDMRFFIRPGARRCRPLQRRRPPVHALRLMPALTARCADEPAAQERYLSPPVDFDEFIVFKECMPAEKRQI